MTNRQGGHDMTQKPQSDVSELPNPAPSDAVVEKVARAGDRAWTADLWDAIDAYVKLMTASQGYTLEAGVKAAAAVEAVVHKVDEGGYWEEDGEPVDPDNPSPAVKKALAHLEKVSGVLARDRQTLVDAVANAHIGCRMGEPDALALLVLLGVEYGEADDLLTAQREEASQP